MENTALSSKRYFFLGMPEKSEASIFRTRTLQRAKAKLFYLQSTPTNDK